MLEPIMRYTLPTRYDDAPYGTICILKSDTEDKFYIQVSQDKTTNTWITMGDMLVGAFKDKLLDDVFIKECLQGYSVHHE